MSSDAVNSPRMCSSIITSIAGKIKKEMRSISGKNHDSILRDTVEAIKQYHWDTVFLELMKNIPTLMNLLKQLVKNPVEKKPLLYFLASQLLKARHQHMGLVQRAVSVMMYGNGCAKQVSLVITIAIIRHFSYHTCRYLQIYSLSMCAYHIREQWISSVEQVKVCKETYGKLLCVIYMNSLIQNRLCWLYIQANTSNSTVTSHNQPFVLAGDSDEEDIDHPPYSPISTISMDDVSHDHSSDDDEADVTDSECETEITMDENVSSYTKHKNNKNYYYFLA